MKGVGAKLSSGVKGIGSACNNTIGSLPKPKISKSFGVDLSQPFGGESRRSRESDSAAPPVRTPHGIATESAVPEPGAITQLLSAGELPLAPQPLSGPHSLATDIRLRRDGNQGEGVGAKITAGVKGIGRALGISD